jgi:N-acetylmuramoyl-L-alanine amidase
MTRLIKRGDRSREVADVQARLRALGIDIEDANGSFEETTEQAVRTFQQRRHILVDGIVGPNTWNELVEAGWRLGDRILYLTRPMMRGDDVRVLQTRLNALGFDAGRADAIFGPDTDLAVRAFQKEYGVAEDGMFGPTTFASLAGLRVDRPGTAAALREELRQAQHSGIKNAFVVLDPGHGGEDLGATTEHGWHEADLCWDLARRVAERLSHAGARVRFSRTEVEGPTESDRARRANELDADVFVSLHLNAHHEGAAGGASTYYFISSRTGEMLADSIQSSLVRLGVKDCRSHGRSYPILRETRMPAVLVEPLFITNPLEEKMLEDPDFRAALADAIADGIESYFDAARP